MDETYIKVKGQWMYLHRAVDSEGNTINFYLSETRDTRAAKRFFKKALRSFHVSKPRVITTDKNPAYPIAIEQLKKEKNISDGMQLRQRKYRNNIVEQDHRFIKEKSPFYARIKNVSNSQTGHLWSEGDAHVEKRTTSTRSEVCPK